MGARPRVWSVVRRAAVGTATAAAVTALTAAASGRLRRVAGASMAPTLADGDLVVVVPARPDRLRVGDVAVVRDPRDRARVTIKRVAALPGTYADLAGEVAEVPPGHLAVRGDDPAASTDSRRYGPVPFDAVEGRAVVRLWPPARL